MPVYWLKAIGHARGPLAEGWIEERPELLRRTGFPRRPRIAPAEHYGLAVEAIASIAAAR